jgi:hypothetical protein
MILAMWNCFSIPFNVAFEPESMQSVYFLVINSIIDVLFLVDIIVNFRTTFFNIRTGDEIYVPIKIARNYLE